MGLAMAVRANFFAELRAPEADREGRWGRTARRTAITMILAGLTLTACAVTLPMPGVVSSLGAAFVLVVALAGIQRRAMVRL